MKAYRKIIYALFLSIVLAGLSGCNGKEKAASKDEKKSAQTTAAKEADKKVVTASSAAVADKKAPTDTKQLEKDVQQFVLKNTKVVKIFNISHRVNEKHPNLGMFFVVRGMDDRGQKTEIWIKDMKIFDMVNSK
ncbi:hypothetical protein KW850_02445 [Bacillus sp. sid0103]|uniref:hypothetical protein n=1 Tax=Bacillus sp. sid0103 TaxID=2856337 RepID=UPI001C45DF64|nr:hypothetical protein [Bacillus sp. sid0103]MBV7504123.1 hypothetical protein [Bacillus sp. sid0103]